MNKENRDQVQRCLKATKINIRTTEIKGNAALKRKTKMTTDSSIIQKLTREQHYTTAGQRTALYKS